MSTVLPPATGYVPISAASPTRYITQPNPSSPYQQYPAHAYPPQTSPYQHTAPSPYSSPFLNTSQPVGGVSSTLFSPSLPGGQPSPLTLNGQLAPGATMVPSGASLGAAFAPLHTYPPSSLSHLPIPALPTVKKSPSLRYDSQSVGRRGDAARRDRPVPSNLSPSSTRRRRQRSRSPPSSSAAAPSSKKRRAVSGDGAAARVSRVPLGGTPEIDAPPVDYDKLTPDERIKYDKAVALQVSEWEKEKRWGLIKRVKALKAAARKEGKMDRGQSSRRRSSGSDSARGSASRRRSSSSRSRTAQDAAPTKDAASTQDAAKSQAAPKIDVLPSLASLQSNHANDEQSVPPLHRCLTRPSSRGQTGGRRRWRSSTA